jgi:hypothetical protein
MPLPAAALHLCNVGFGRRDHVATMTPLGGELAGRLNPAADICGDLMRNGCLPNHSKVDCRLGWVGIFSMSTELMRRGA